jgi:hypothetical protein
MGLPAEHGHHELRYWRRSTVLPRLVAAGCVQRMWRPGVGTGVMMNKAACVVLILAVPGFLGYPAALNVDPREKKSPPSVESITVELWPAPPTTVVSPQPRWLIIQDPATSAQALGGDVLTKELQRQLRRVGCYNGEIQGEWTQSTRRAMQNFTDRVNATLPVEQPDHVLLALLQNNPDKTCNKPCSLGENPAPDGRCVPGVIADLSVKTAALSRPQPLITSWTAVETAALEDDVYNRPPVTAAPVRPPPAPRMVIGPLPPPRSATANREQGRTSQRSDREQSRPMQHSEFVRTLFQRLDGSAR